MAIEKKRNTPVPTAKLSKAADFRSIYANNAVFEVSVFDIRITFGESSKGSSDEPMEVEQKVSILMSPQHAKLFAQLLLSNVEGYEKQIAPIALPHPS
jgi:hypothetical protein